MRTAILYNFLIEANMMASIAILLMMILRKTLRRTLGNCCICFGWLLAALRLLLPLSFANPVIHTIRSPFAEDAVIRPIAGQILVRTHDMVLMAKEVSAENGIPVVADAAGSVLDSINYGTIGTHLMKLYLLGVVLVTAWFVASNVYFRLKLRADRVDRISGKLLEQYESLCRERGVKPVPVIFTDPLPSACLVGVIRPYIALPLTASPAEVIHVLTHEICHLKNGDHLWSLLRLICCAVHWFNPLVWIAADMSRTDAELRCDDRVVRPMNIDQKKAYANILVLAAARRNAPGVMVLATGMTMTGKRLKTRVMTVMQGKQPMRWLTVTFSVLASMCLVCAFATSEMPLRVEADDEWTPRYATTGLQGEAALTDPEAAAAYADHLWRDVLGGKSSKYTGARFGDQFQAQGVEDNTSVCWQMTLTDSGVVTDYSATYPESDRMVSLTVDQYPAHQEEIDRAMAYLYTIIDNLAPGVTGRTADLVIEDISMIGDATYFSFALTPADEESYYVFVTVRKTPDGAMQVIRFGAAGNG